METWEVNIWWVGVNMKWNVWDDNHLPVQEGVWFDAGDDEFTQLWTMLCSVANMNGVHLRAIVVEDGNERELRV